MSRANPTLDGALERAIFEARTRALAQTTEAQRVLEGTESLVVRAGGQRVALDLRYVVAASPLARLTLAPLAPPEVAGLALIRGLVAPVFHLHVVLGLPVGSLPEHGRMVLVGDTAAPVALAVELAESILTVHDASLRPLPESASRTSRVARGITEDGVVVLDIAALLRDPTLTVNVAPRLAERD